MIPPASNGSTDEFKVYAEDSHGSWGVSAIYTYNVQDPSSATTTDTTETDQTDSVVD